jgi:hypothetical protein
VKAVGIHARREVRLRSKECCEARVKCEGVRAQHFHHRRRAGRVDTVENLMHLCCRCHDWIHANIAKSFVLGWLVHSWADPAEVPVCLPGEISTMEALA